MAAATSGAALFSNELRFAELEVKLRGLVLELHSPVVRDVEAVAKRLSQLEDVEEKQEAMLKILNQHTEDLGRLEERISEEAAESRVREQELWKSVEENRGKITTLGAVLKTTERRILDEMGEKSTDLQRKIDAERDHVRERFDQLHAEQKRDRSSLEEIVEKLRDEAEKDNRKQRAHIEQVDQKFSEKNVEIFQRIDKLADTNEFLERGQEGVLESANLQMKRAAATDQKVATLLQTLESKGKIGDNNSLAAQSATFMRETRASVRDEISKFKAEVRLQVQNSKNELEALVAEEVARVHSILNSQSRVITGRGGGGGGRGHRGSFSRLGSVDSVVTGRDSFQNYNRGADSSPNLGSPRGSFHNNEGRGVSFRNRQSVKGVDSDTTPRGSYQGWGSQNRRGSTGSTGERRASFQQSMNAARRLRANISGSSLALGEDAESFFLQATGEASAGGGPILRRLSAGGLVADHRNVDRSGDNNYHGSSPSSPRGGHQLQASGPSSPLTTEQEQDRQRKRSLLEDIEEDERTSFRAELEQAAAPASGETILIPCGSKEGGGGNSPRNMNGSASTGRRPIVLSGAGGASSGVDGHLLVSTLMGEEAANQANDVADGALAQRQTSEVLVTDDPTKVVNVGVVEPGILNRSAIAGPSFLIGDNGKAQQSTVFTGIPNSYEREPRLLEPRLYRAETTLTALFVCTRTLLQCMHLLLASTPPLSNTSPTTQLQTSSSSPIVNAADKSSKTMFLVNPTSAHRPDEDMLGKMLLKPSPRPPAAPPQGWAQLSPSTRAGKIKNASNEKVKMLFQREEGRSNKVKLLVGSLDSGCSNRNHGTSKHQLQDHQQQNQQHPRAQNNRNTTQVEQQQHFCRLKQVGECEDEMGGGGRSQPEMTRKMVRKLLAEASRKLDNNSPRRALVMQSQSSAAAISNRNNMNNTWLDERRVVDGIMLGPGAGGQVGGMEPRLLPRVPSSP
ncbi:unnamed protein product [Amoebophrya sp. A25]|nr:unnamed protein product [Amoebophrya sp. A25]|eukprot:GSA25T00004553001.1